MVDPIDPGLALKLDAFTVPPLSRSFADGLLARAMDLPAAADAPSVPPLPRARRPHLRRWWRSGAVGLSAVALGMVSISAAAMGYFGEPIRLAVHRTPVIGKVVERVIPDHLRAKRLPVHRALVAKPHVVPDVQSATPPAVIDAPPPPLPPRLRARAEVRAILADPQARKVWLEQHPEAARRIAARRRIRAERSEALSGGAARPDMRLPGTLPFIAPQAGPRFERLQRLRERRRQMLELRRSADAAAVPSDSVSEAPIP